MATRVMWHHATGINKHWGGGINGVCPCFLSMLFFFMLYVHLRKCYGTYDTYFESMCHLLLGSIGFLIK